MSKNDKVQEIISEILEEATSGLHYDPDIQMQKITLGYDELISHTQIAFNLPLSWKEMDFSGETLGQFTKRVATIWDGESYTDWH